MSGIKTCVGILLATLLFASCWRIADVLSYDPNELLTFQNNSGDTLMIAISLDYPDTLYPRRIRGCYEPVGPHESRTLDLGHTREEAFSNPILQLFVYNWSQFMSFSREQRETDIKGSIRWSNMELRRYELTKEWMEEHNWTVTYP